MTRQIERARELRRDSSLTERICWELIRAHRMDGIKFLRQHQSGRYFADFACISRKIVIEIDGEHRDDQIAADAKRTADLEREGWRMIRFSASEVMRNREGVWGEIQLALDGRVLPLS